MTGTHWAPRPGLGLAAPGRPLPGCSFGHDALDLGNATAGSSGRFATETARARMSGFLWGCRAEMAHKADVRPSLGRLWAPCGATIGRELTQHKVSSLTSLNSQVQHGSRVSTEGISQSELYLNVNVAWKGMSQTKSVTVKFLAHLSSLSVRLGFLHVV